MSKQAAGSQHRVSYIKEVTPGVIPVTPEWQKLRYTGFNGGIDKTQNISAEIREDRQISDLRLGLNKTSFEIPLEFSYGTFDDFLEGALFSTWATDVLKSGVNSVPFSFERFHSDISTYLRYSNCVVDKFKLKLELDKMVTGSFSFIGNGSCVIDTAEITGATYLPQTTELPYDTSVGVIKEGGVTSAYITALDLELSNGCEAQYGLFNKIAHDITAKNSDVKGNVTVMFLNKTAYEKFLNETESSIEFTLGSVENTYTFLLPRVKFVSGKVDVPNDGPVSVVLAYQALLDSVTGTNIRVTRSAA